MTRYLLWRSNLPTIKIHKADREKLLTPLKILKEAGCTATEISQIEVQRTFPIDSTELKAWYEKSAREGNLARRHNQAYAGYCAGQIRAAYEAAKIGEEITSVVIWTEERRRTWQ